MKIIKLGKIKFTELVYKATCDKCGCEFEFDDTDVEEKESSLSYKKVRCPCCSRKVECFIDFEEEGYPKRITIQRDFFDDGTFEDKVIKEGE